MQCSSKGGHVKQTSVRINEWDSQTLSKTTASAIVVQTLSCVQLFVTPWTAAHQAPAILMTSHDQRSPHVLEQHINQSKMNTLSVTGQLKISIPGLSICDSRLSHVRLSGSPNFEALAWVHPQAEVARAIQISSLVSPGSLQVAFYQLWLLPQASLHHIHLMGKFLYLGTQSKQKSCELLILKYVVYFLNWSRVVLQCCVRFSCTTK